MRVTNSTYITLVEDPKVAWADTLSVVSNGYLYFKSNQLNRLAEYKTARIYGRNCIIYFA